jgi:hypothetical protein
MTQANLFDAPPLPAIARKSDPLGSKIAARKVRDSGQEATQCAKVLILVKDYPGRTSKELAALTWEFDRYQIARRLSTLEHIGKVCKGGFKERTKEVTWIAV